MPCGAQKAMAIHKTSFSFQSKKRVVVSSSLGIYAVNTKVAGSSRGLWKLESLL